MVRSMANSCEAFAIESFAPVELRSQLAERAATPHRLTQVVEAFADQPGVVHQRFGTESGTTPR